MTHNLLESVFFTHCFEVVRHDIYVIKVFFCNPNSQEVLSLVSFVEYPHITTILCSKSYFTKPMDVNYLYQF